MHHLALGGDVRGAQHDARQVHGEKSVAAQLAGYRKREQRDGDKHDGFALRLEVHATGKFHANPAKRQAKRGAKDNLLRDEHGQVDGFAQRQGTKHGSEHVGERVVGARLDLEQRVGAALERKPVLAQDGENACGVGGRDDGAQKERQRPVKAQGQHGQTPR